MPVAKFNYTGRLRIKQSDALVTVHSAGSAFWFSADITLGDYELRGDALVFVDAYRQTKRIRFPFGTVECLRQPPENECQLGGEFSTPDGVLFRVNVVDPTTGMFLAQADRINPDRKGGRESLLSVIPADLGQECWNVNFEGERPILQINEDIYPDWRSASTSPDFLSLVYPAVLREILNHILRVEGYNGTDEDDSWSSLWLRLAENRFGAGSPPVQDEYEDDIPTEQIDEWIDGAVAGYARREEALRTYRDGEVSDD